MVWLPCVCFPAPSCSIFLSLGGLWAGVLGWLLGGHVLDLLLLHLPGLVSGHVQVSSTLLVCHKLGLLHDPEVPGPLHALPPLLQGPVGLGAPLQVLGPLHALPPLLQGPVGLGAPLQVLGPLHVLLPLLQGLVGRGLGTQHHGPLHVLPPWVQGLVGLGHFLR